MVSYWQLFHVAIQQCTVQEMLALTKYYTVVLW